MKRIFLEADSRGIISFRANSGVIQQESKKNSLTLGGVQYNKTFQLAPIEVEKAIHDTIRGSYAADDGVAFLYINNNLISAFVVPNPKSDINDDFINKEDEKKTISTIKDGENYLLHGMRGCVFNKGDELMKRVNSNMTEKEVERINDWTKLPYKTKVNVKTPEEFDVNAEIVGSAGACDHCKSRLSNFKSEMNGYLSDLISKNYAVKESNCLINYHYTTIKQQTGGHGPGGKYGWDDAAKETGKIGKHRLDANEKEYTWWSKNI